MEPKKREGIVQVWAGTASGWERAVAVSW